MPRVSVVVSHYDRQALLVEALESIAAQTYRDFESIVVNDHGADSAAIAERFGARYDYRDRNRGVAATRNRGVELARGELIAYLDDDDLWTPDHLEGLVGALDAAAPSGAALAYGDAEVWRVEGGLVAARLPLAVPFDYADLARDDFIVPGATLHTRALYDEIGPFDESLFVSDDWDWLLRVANARGAKAFVRHPHIIVTVRIFGPGENLSADFSARRIEALKELERRHAAPPLEPKTFWEVAETYARRRSVG
jgi:glycosyltransferase involved in cell wall biosynthesis